MPESKASKDNVDVEGGDEILRRLLKTPPQPKEAEQKEKAKAKPKKKKPTK